MVRMALVAAAFVIVMAGAVWIFLASQQAAAVAGKTIIPVFTALILYVLSQVVFPEATKLFLAWLLRKLKRLPRVLKQWVIASEIDGNLTRAVKEYGAEGSGMLPYKPKLVWVSAGEVKPTSFRRGRKIIIMLDYSDDPHRNIVEAALLYCRTGLIPETRRYLWSSLRRSLDLVFVKAVLERNGLDDGLLYFMQDVLERELEKTPNVGQDYNTLHGLHERGVFTRILLPELRDYAGRVERADTRAQHEAWIKNFIDFLESATQQRPHGSKRVLDHIRKRFRVSVVIVGEPQKLAYHGQKLYLKAIAMCAMQGARVVFVLGDSRTIPSIAKNALELGIADAKDCQSYHRTLRDQVRQIWCVRLDISEQTAASAADRIAEMKDWPELDAAPETGQGRPARVAGG